MKAQKKNKSKLIFVVELVILFAILFGLAYQSGFRFLKGLSSNSEGNQNIENGSGTGDEEADSNGNSEGNAENTDGTGTGNEGGSGAGNTENAGSGDGAGNAENEGSGNQAVAVADPEFHPHCVESTKPENLLSRSEVQVNGQNVLDYVAAEQITFGQGDAYSDLEGILTFRGNNFRDTAAYGYANMTEYTMTELWTQNTGGLTYEGKTWTGSGWTGQPLMMKWPRAMKAHMNMEDWAKEDDELVEVIYACMDGYVYFLDLETGKQTRKPLNLGFTFKGSGALDPRGYPIMYLGSGYDSNEGRSRVFIINLLDCSVMHTFGVKDPYSLRGSLSYFDSSALVDAETDTLIYPGENGILYLMKLNTAYDEANGTLSINPNDVVKWRYYGTRSQSGSGKYWVGMETSAAVYKGYLFIADNGGLLMCLDLNTLKPVWVQDILDDSNSTPVLSVEEGRLYLYVSTSFHLGWRSSTTANVPIWKIDAKTGEIVWQKDYECYSLSGVSGGVQSTIALGKNQLNDSIYVTVSMTGSQYGGVLACLNKKTGEVTWEHKASYAWSSPVCVYNEDGTGKVIYGSSAGKMYLLDGLTGEVHNEFRISEGVIEASPAVYKNRLVVGTRAGKIWGIGLN